MKAVVTLSFPPMPTRHISRGLARTDAITAPGACVLDDGTNYGFHVSIPQAYVRGQESPFHWIVDQCVCSTPPGLPVTFTSTLPPEPCEIKVSFRDGIYMKVEAIQGDATIKLPNGMSGNGVMLYPECKSHWQSPGLWIVDAVQSVMTLELS